MEDTHAKMEDGVLDVRCQAADIPGGGYKNGQNKGENTGGGSTPHTPHPTGGNSPNGEM
jgi:hypothetical protein